MGNRMGKRRRKRRRKRRGGKRRRKRKRRWRAMRCQIGGGLELSIDSDGREKFKRIDF